MSKFLKFIVHFVVICTILCVIALAAPPFMGIKTEIMEKSDKSTNLPVGSVTYAIPVKASEVSLGNDLLVQEENLSYRYRITEMNLEENIFTAVDPQDASSERVKLSVKEYVPKVVVTVPYLGYLLVATESIEGLIILGLAVLFLIILYVIAELWKREPQDLYDDEDDEYETGYVKSKKELKREEKERARQYKEEERQIKREDKPRRKEKKKIRTGGFVDEIYEDDFEPERSERPVTVQRATSEAHELLRKEIAAATADDPQEKQRQEKQVREELREVQEPVEKPSEEESVIKEDIPAQRMAVPAWSAAQIAEAAKRRGDAPEIVKDDVTNVTLFDYSDIIAGDNTDPQSNE